MNLQPFFIIGAPRSGTTMLQLALARHSRVAIPPETHFFTLLLRSFRGQQRHWKRIEKYLRIQLDSPTRRIRPGVEAREHFGRLAKSYLDRMRHLGITHFGEKSPEHQLRIPQILETFPQARFVLIYRDGRDVALSLRKVEWMPNDLYVNFLVWLRYYRIQRRFLQQEPQRVICVRYEDLVQNPKAELRPILEFLGLDYEPQVAEGSGNRAGVRDDEMSYKRRALEPISSNRIGTWTRELTRKEIARLERWGGWALRELHYDCPTEPHGVVLPWYVPWAYGRVATTVGVRTLQRKLDEWLGTSFYWPNQIARDIPPPEPLPERSLEPEKEDVDSRTWKTHL